MVDGTGVAVRETEEFLRAECARVLSRTNLRRAFCVGLSCASGSESGAKWRRDIDELELTGVSEDPSSLKFIVMYRNDIGAVSEEAIKVCAGSYGGTSRLSLAVRARRTT